MKSEATKAIEEITQNIKDGKPHPRQIELLGLALMVQASQNKLDSQNKNDKSIFKWAIKLIKSMGKFPTGNK